MKLMVFILVKKSTYLIQLVVQFYFFTYLESWLFICHLFDNFLLILNHDVKLRLSWNSDAMFGQTFSQLVHVLIINDCCVDHQWLSLIIHQIESFYHIWNFTVYLRVVLDFNWYKFPLGSFFLRSISVAHWIRTRSELALHNLCSVNRPILASWTTTADI